MLAPKSGLGKCCHWLNQSRSTHGIHTCRDSTAMRTHNTQHTHTHTHTKHIKTALWAHVHQLVPSSTDKSQAGSKWAKAKTKPTQTGWCQWKIELAWLE